MDNSFYPTAKRSKKPSLFLAIDMWGIEGEYADGNWHGLIHEFAHNWSAAHPQQDTATLWSSVQPCALYNNGTSCYLAGSSKLPDGFFSQLESHLRARIGSHARIGGEILVDAEEWRVYLHFENGCVWEKYNGYEWRELAVQTGG